MTLLVNEDTFKGFWKGEEAKVLLNLKADAANPYRLVSLGTVSTKDKAERVFASVIGTNLENSLLKSRLSDAILPYVNKNHSVRRNALDCAKSIALLLSKDQCNVVVDTIGMKVLTDNKAVMAKFAEAGLGAKMQLNHVRKKNWESVLAKTLQAAVAQELVI